MKKNAMLKIAAILMVAVLLTTCAISSTFAKYATANTDTVTARVAKFGVTVTSAVDGLFSSSYTKAGFTDADVATVETVGETTTLVNVVAPGTEGGLTVAGTITGTPEVAVEVGYSANLTLTGWTLADDTVYCPLVFTVGDDTFTYAAATPANADETKLEAFEREVEEAIASYTKQYAPNKNLADADVTAFAVSWKWDFEVDTDNNAENGISNDVKDTYLGDQAAAGHASTVTLSLTLTVEQIDGYSAPVTESTEASEPNQGEGEGA